jgi:hypothetical protein
MMEEWRDAVGYEGYYQISSHGKVRSISSGNEMSIFSDNRGYQRVALRKNGFQKKIRVHRLVCISFLPNPDNKPFVNHKDGNPSNNNIENLEWVTNSENVRHAYTVLGKNGPNKGKFGKLNHKSKAVKMIDYAGNVIRIFDCVRDAARIGGFDNGCVSKCCNGKLKKHGGFIWEFA